MNKLNNSISSAKKIAKTSISGALLSILISCTDNENNNENNNKNYINAKQKIEHIYSENSLKEFTQTILPYGLTGNDREDINILNHLATKHFILEQTIKSINPNQIGNMLEYSSPKLNATVIEFIMKCYPLNLILTWPINSRIKIYMLGFATLEELNLTINDLPSNSIEEKVLFHNQGIEKTLEFNESLKLYKNIIIVLDTEIEKEQFKISFKEKGEGIILIKKTKHTEEYIHNNTNIYVANGSEGLSEFSDLHANKKLGCIILKGHYSMKEKFDNLKSFIVPHSTVVFAGGCNSFMSLGNYIKTGSIPITNKKIGYGIINDNLTFSLIKNLPSKGLKRVLNNYKKYNPQNSKNFAFPEDIETKKVNGLI